MKSIFLLVIFISFSSFSQDSLLKFDKKIYECENEWATLPKKEKDSTYMLGLIYFDPYKGYVFNYMNSFTIDKSNNKFKPIEEQTTSSVINVVTNTEIKFSVIPKSKYRELNIEKINKSINIKRYSENNPEDLVKKGNILNHIGVSNIAIPILEKALKIKPNTKDLLFELSYAYNATKQYKSTIPLLHKGIKTENNNWLLYKELIFALVFDNQLENAEATYKNGVIIAKSNTDLVESAYNIAYGYFLKKDKQKFEEWTKITLGNTDGVESAISKNLNLMKKDF